MNSFFCASTVKCHSLRTIGTVTTHTWSDFSLEASGLPDVNITSAHVNFDGLMWQETPPTSFFLTSFVIMLMILHFWVWATTVWTYNAGVRLSLSGNVRPRLPRQSFQWLSLVWVFCFSLIIRSKEWVSGSGLTCCQYAAALLGVSTATHL